MQTVLIVIHLLIVLALIGVVLLQRSEGGGLGIGGGSGGFMTNRGTANMLTRATALLATGFFITSLSLSILAGWRPAAPTVIQQNQPGGPAAPAPLNPNAPTILEQLQKQTPQGPQAPQSK
ncbi:MAG TPA: preprotein translocase subunit SecG [Xanthobacteraceae bacterium]|nr:preprotein translocase subunit SecG [Xanthobacteraceae bacterium]